MANEEHLAILRQGVDVWNKWREENPDVRPDLRWADLHNSALSGADLCATDLHRADLSGADLCGADLSETDLRKANLSGADLSGADLHNSNLSGADLSTTDLHGAYLNGAELDQANLSEAKLSGAKLIAGDLSGVNLSGADLSHSDLFKAILIGANLTGASLSHAELIGANLSGADLSEADLSQTGLGSVDFNTAILVGANLSGADLFRANLSAVNLRAANLSEAHVEQTVFVNTDLSAVVGLEKVSHRSPSSIGIDTLIRSRGKIPESFLRGCGVPQSFIDYLPSLIGAMEPIQFYSCFISYSTKDEEFAKRLHSKMRDNNLRVWFANEDLKGGHKLDEQIEEAIRVYDKLIIVLSPESLRSKWVMSEVRRTRKAELASHRRKFFPIALLPYRELEGWECIDPETGRDLAAEIREYYIPDFRDWKNHDSFEKAFTQLLEGLKAVDAPPAPRAAPKISDPIPNPSESKRRRLKLLEDQQARMGVLTPPHITMEIEDLRSEIGESEG